MTIERTYSDNEVALILRRAMEMQHDSTVRGEGLGLRELREIAREIGVDPDLVTEAASRLPATRPGTFARLAGGSVRQDIRLVHDAALSPEQLQDLVMAIRSVMQHQGRTSEVLGALEWTTVGEVSLVAVTARTRGDRTTVHVIADRSGSAVLTIVGSFAFGALLAVVAGAALEPGAAGGVALMGAGLVGGAAMARVIWQRTTRGFQKRLDRLNEAIQRAFDG